MQTENKSKNFEFLGEVEAFPKELLESLCMAEQAYYNQDTAECARKLRFGGEQATRVMLRELNIDSKAKFPNPEYQENNAGSKKEWDMQHQYDRLEYLRQQGHLKSEDNLFKNLHKIRKVGNNSQHIDDYSAIPSQEDVAKLLKTAFFMAKDLTNKYKKQGQRIIFPKFYLEPIIPLEQAKNEKTTEILTQTDETEKKQYRSEAIHSTDTVPVNLKWTVGIVGVVLVCVSVGALLRGNSDIYNTINNTNTASSVAQPVVNNTHSQQNNQSASFQASQSQISQMVSQVIDLETTSYLSHLSEDELLKQADNDMNVQHELALRMYAKGDREQAIEWIKKAAKSGHVDAQNELGFLYRNGTLGLVEDWKEAVKWFMEASDQGSVYAAWQIARITRQEFHEGKERKILALYEDVARMGSNEAKLALAEMYLSGRIKDENTGSVIEEDPQKAKQLLEEADAAGYIPATYTLSDTRISDVQEQLWYLERIVELTNENKPIFERLKKRKKYSLLLHKRYAEINLDLQILSTLSSALFDLAHIYDDPSMLDGMKDVVTEDKKKAIDYLEQCAKLNYPPFTTSDSYQFMDRSIYTFTHSRLSRIVDCQYGLAKRYEKGDGVEKNLEQAKYWYTEVIKNKKKDSQESVEYAKVALERLNKSGLE